MTIPLVNAPSTADVQAVEEVLRVFAKGQRALQMYLPNNPVYQRTLQQVTEAFGPVWNITGKLVLDIAEDAITWDGTEVFTQAKQGEGLAWQLYKDGLRQLSFSPGVETEEIFQLMRVLNRARLLQADAADDLLTLLWEQEFVLVSYGFVEVTGDVVDFKMDGKRDGSGSGAGFDGTGGSGGSGNARDEVQAGRAAAASDGETGPGAGYGMVDLEDFDATPYFLDETEIRYIQNELDEEYRRDIAEAAIDALLDILEIQREPAVRREVIALLDDILPAQLASGGFHAVARILRELRLIASRARDLDAELQQAVLSFEERLSTPEILGQLFRVLSDNTARPSDEDVGEVLRELRPAALPVVLTHLGRISDPAVRRTLESGVDAIARAQPTALATLIGGGPSDALIPAIALAGRLALGQLVPAIVEHLQLGDDAVRLASLRALGEIGTPSAITAVESALSDPERSVRQGALTMLMSRGGSGGLPQRLEAMLFDATPESWERSERRAMFEAYGTVAGAAAIPRLKELLEARGVFRRRAAPDSCASALFALAKVKTLAAREIVERFTSDKEPVVRSAANTALREWNS